MKRFTVAVLFVVCLFDFSRTDTPLAAAQLPSRSPAPPESARYVREIGQARAAVAELVKTKQILGLSIAVSVAGTIVWSEGFGFADVEQQAIVTPQTRFRLGSVSKVLTAAGLARLVEEGRLDLDAPVQRYVPNFPIKPWPLTTRQLAGHLGGIRHYQAADFTGPLKGAPHFDSVTKALTVFQDDPLSFEPETSYGYSSYGWNLVGAVIEGAAKEEFLTYMRRSVFEPLGLRHIAADEVRSIVPHRTRFYARTARGELVHAPYVDNSYKWASGGFLSNADDLVRFGSAHLQPGFLQQKTLDLLFTPQRLRSGKETGVGIGWRIGTDPRGRRVLHHGGTIEGGRTMLMMYPESKVVVAMMANALVAFGEQDAQTIGSIFLAPPPSAIPQDEARAWRDDLRVMAAELERMHKNLYHAVSREKFAAMVSALDAQIPSLRRHEVIVEMARIVAAVADGHTNIYPTRDRKIGFHALPVAFTFFGDELYIRSAHESQRGLAGARVLRVGDRDVATAYSSVKTMIGHDNEQGARYWAPYLLAMPEVLQALHITETIEDVPLTVVTTRGEESVILHPFAPVEIMTGDTATLFNRRDGWIDVRDLSGRPEPPWLRGAGDAFHFEHAGHMLYVQINTVGDKTDETLAQFSRRLHDEIAATKPEQVAIDLRLNRGGDGTLVVPVIRALIQSENIDRTGRLFAITGPATFSAAQMFVDALEKYTHVTFVGEPTGSKGNAYGDSRQIVLPNSGITVRASIYYWQDWHPMDRRDATIPKIPAPLTFDAYRNNIDPALRAIASAGTSPGR